MRAAGGQNNLGEGPFYNFSASLWKSLIDLQTIVEYWMIQEPYYNQTALSSWSNVPSAIHSVEECQRLLPAISDTFITGCRRKVGNKLSACCDHTRCAEDAFILVDYHRNTASIKSTTWFPFKTAANLAIKASDVDSWIGNSKAPAILLGLSPTIRRMGKVLGGSSRWYYHLY
jgi:hypothetical protein